jgi:hypothetical protein
VHPTRRLTLAGTVGKARSAQRIATQSLKTGVLHWTGVQIPSPPLSDQAEQVEGDAVSAGINGRLVRSKDRRLGWWQDCVDQGRRRSAPATSALARSALGRSATVRSALVRIASFECAQVRSTRIHLAASTARCHFRFEATAQEQWTRSRISPPPPIDLHFVDFVVWLVFHRTTVRALDDRGSADTTCDPHWTTGRERVIRSLAQGSLRPGFCNGLARLNDWITDSVLTLDL